VVEEGVEVPLPDLDDAALSAFVQPTPIETNWNPY
jgi:hypothetical protein